MYFALMNIEQFRKKTKLDLVEKQNYDLIHSRLGQLYTEIPVNGP